MGIIDSDDLDRFAEDKRKREMKKEIPIAGINPIKQVMPVVTNDQTEEVIKLNKLLVALHDEAQITLKGSRERALFLTKLEESHFHLITCGCA